MAALRPASLVPPGWEPRRVSIGAWTVTALSDGHMRLDGGAMWGVVPAAIWRTMTPPREDNTVLIALRPFLLERDALRVVLEPGIGQRWGAKERRIYGIEARTTLVQSLAACGLTPADVTHVVATHCHWDHLGAWAVERGGELAPLFPGAVHFAPAIETRMAKDPGHVRRSSYRAEDVEAIERAGLLRTYSGSAELLSGLRAHVLGGHSDGVSVVTVNEDGPGPGAIFWSDVVPTAHHVQPPYIMAFDLDVARSYDVRSEWLARAAERGWLSLFYHDPDVAFGRLTRPGKRYELEPVEGELLSART